MYKLSRVMLALAMLLYAYFLVLAVILGLIWFPGVAWIVLIVAIAYKANQSRKSRPKVTDACGTARWADSADVRRARMLDARSGLILGRLLGDDG